MPWLRADDVLTVADRLVHQHLSYVYGSEDLHNGGLDCSGFTQVVFREAYGVELPDEADKQLAYLHEHGQVWDSASGWTKETLQPGDLIFYAGPYQLSRTSLISHVMMYCGHGVMAGAQGKGRRIDGGSSGVGYYAFWPHAPAGIWGESGERFLNHRQIFAYGRLNGVPGHISHELIVSVPTPLAPLATGLKAPATSTADLSFDLKVVGINPRFD
ncbi:MAG TPA: NlpC/P60 family protein [Candidatus Methylacidiphilales bacterium]